MTTELIHQFGDKIHLLRDPTRGGLATVLNEIVRSTPLGIRMDEQNIPMEDEVESACELLGLDPLHVANEGVFVAFVDEEIAQKCCTVLRNFYLGRNSTLIGKVVSDNPGRVVLTNVSGGNRVVRMLSGMQLPRIC